MNWMGMFAFAIGSALATAYLLWRNPELFDGTSDKRKP